MTKQQYAARYDASADAFYRFALLTLGDPQRAAPAVSAVFRAGYSVINSTDSFQNQFLALLWQQCAHTHPAQRTQYRAAFCAKAALPETLAGLWWDERGLLLLQNLFGCDIKSMAEITRQPPLRVRRRCDFLYNQLCPQGKSDAAAAVLFG